MEFNLATWLRIINFTQFKCSFVAIPEIAKSKFQWKFASCRVSIFGRWFGYVMWSNLTKTLLLLLTVHFVLMCAKRTLIFPWAYNSYCMYMPLIFLWAAKFGKIIINNRNVLWTAYMHIPGECYGMQEKNAKIILRCPSIHTCHGSDDFEKHDS